MGLLTKLKSLLGFDDDRSQVRRSESGVTIEREPDESVGSAPGTESEESTGTERDAEPEGEVTDASAAEADESDAAPDGIEEAESTADSETETVESDETVEADAESVESDDVPESDESADADAAEVEADDADAVDADAAETEVEPDEAESDAAEPEEAEPDETPGAGEPLEDVKGIGAAYAERLREAGVEDVADLAAADADALAGETDLSAKRISTWIERAQSR